MSRFTALCLATLLVATGVACAKKADPVAETETIFLEFLDAANAVGAIDSGLYTEYEGRDLAAWQALEQKHRAALAAKLDAIDETPLEPYELNAVAAMRRTFGDYANEVLTGDAKPTCADRTRTDLDFATMTEVLTECFRELGNNMTFEGGTIDRGSALHLLHDIKEPKRRKAVFDAFLPLWAALNGKNEPDSPYRRVIQMAAEEAKKNGSYVDQAAKAIGVTNEDVERWLIEMLDAWREASGPAPMEPWDFRYTIGEANRLLAEQVPADMLGPVNERFYFDLGADLDALGIVYDLEPRADKSPLAYCDFLKRGRSVDGAWQPTIARVVGNYPFGGLFSLNELVHENGHAVHISAIRNRPAFTDWPDTLFTEAFADVTSWSVYQPAWQQKYLGTAIDEKTSLRSLFGNVMLDVAWSLFELRMLREPTADPNVVWTDITSQYLHIKPHPEVPWWAMRVQLGGSPGYMVHYGLGAVLTAEIRKRTIEAIGAIDAGNPKWYGWTTEQLLVYGSERDTKRLMQDFLGRPLSSAAVLEQIGRMN